MVKVCSTGIVGAEGAYVFVTQEEVEVYTMRENLLKKTIQTGAQAYAGLDATKVKAKVQDALDDSVTSARRAVKQGRHAAEDMLDEAVYCIKKNPLSAVGVSFWAGFGLGAVAIWVGLHNHNHKA